MKLVTNGQLSLEKSCSRLVKKIIDILKELPMDEDRSQASGAIMLDKHVYRHLRYSISIDALQRIDVDWQLVSRLVAAANGPVDLGPLRMRTPLPIRSTL
jgi:hypothetical protein